MTGSEFVRKIRHLAGDQRDAAILKEIRSGNIPGHLRKLAPVTTTMRVDGRLRRVTYYVMPDYLAVGSDQDFVRVPLNPITAQKIADEFNFSLPTTRMVDEVNRHAAVRLSPSPLPPGRRMASTDYFWRHHQMIEKQRKGKPKAGLVAGHKKDVVVTNRLMSRPRQVAIYGWHRKSGRPIQPLSLVHDNKYADYSHGIRLVSDRAVVDGKARSLESVMRDRQLARIVSNEGPMRLVSAAPAGFQNSSKARLAKKSKPQRGKRLVKHRRA